MQEIREVPHSLDSTDLAASFPATANTANASDGLPANVAGQPARLLSHGGLGVDEQESGCRRS